MDGSSLAKAYAHNKRVGNALRCQIDILSLVDTAHGTTNIFVTTILWIDIATHIYIYVVGC